MGVTPGEAAGGMLRWCTGCRIYWVDYVSDPEADEYEPHGCGDAAMAEAGQ